VETKRAANLTRQLLMFSRRSVIQSRLVDMNELVQNLLKMLRRLLGENITITFDSQSNLPAVEVDIGMIEQVLMNLAVNARDAMPRAAS
jgi:two-component system cell cycle sensor histidine kinase/response regulator CckA